MRETRGENAVGRTLPALVFAGSAGVGDAIRPCVVAHFGSEISRLCFRGREVVVFLLFLPYFLTGEKTGI